MNHTRICRYLDEETARPRFGLVEGEEIAPLPEGSSLERRPSEALDADAAARP